MARIYPKTNKAAHPAKETKVVKREDIKDPEDVRKLNSFNLAALAADLELDISGCKNNGERAELIIAALEKKAGGSGEE